jgi:hypothetical protein
VQNTQPFFSSERAIKGLSVMPQNLLLVPAALDALPESFTMTLANVSHC